MRIWAYLLLAAGLSGSTVADEFYNAYLQEDAGAYLDEQDQNTLEKLRILESRKLKGEALSPGKVVFTYGSGIPTVVCAILELTDITLQEGERTLSVQLGDAVRWNVDSAVSGEGTSRVEHLIIKALDSELKTSMLVTTDRRSYHFRLKSTASDYMPQVSFYYPNSKIMKKTQRSDYGSNTALNYTYNTNEISKGIDVNTSLAGSSLSPIESGWHLMLIGPSAIDGQISNICACKIPSFPFTRL